MDSTKKELIGAAVVLVAIGVVVAEAQLKAQPAVDEKTLSAQQVSDVRALRLSDSSLVYVVANSDGTATKLAQSPCAWKPDEKAKCWKLDGGDPGTANTMQPGQFAGPECRRKSCVIFAGQPDDDDALPTPEGLTLDEAPLGLEVLKP